MMKKMFELQKDESGETIRINSSSLSILQSCKRKAHYLFDAQMSAGTSNAQYFGTIIHAALARWYMIMPEDRHGMSLSEIARQEFSRHGYVPDDDLRTVEVATRVMDSYQKETANDPYLVMRDYNGKPMVEWEFEFPLGHTPDGRKIIWFGTVDLVLKNTQTSEVVVMDHKTTRSLGMDFMHRWNPNHQVTGYLMGVANNLERPVNHAVINGLQIAKTVNRVMRIDSYRSVEDFEEFKETVSTEVWLYLQAKEAGLFPMAQANVCTGFGLCKFIDVCSTSKSNRHQLLAAATLNNIATQEA